ncbi:MAG: hypothetical protein ACI8YQ_001196 [Polaribacter sp.]|jgi:hypothetical protein
MTLLRTFLFFSFLLVANTLFAQPNEKTEKLTIDGQIITALITETDTILIADLGDVSVSSLRSFSDKEDYRRYLKYRRYAAKVYPFAAQGIRIFKEMEVATSSMKKRKRKKHIRRLQRELKKEFKKPLKGLTRTQGKILVKMIEKELDRDFYGLMKELRGSVTASYYHGFSKMYGYDLKKKYKEGDDPILDAVLQDFDLSYEVEELED